MDRPKIIILATVPRQLECVKNNFSSCLNRLAHVRALHSVSMWYSPVSMTENNKRTVCHLARNQMLTLAWGDWKATAISLSQGRLKIPRHKELVAWARKITQGKIKPSRNCLRPMASGSHSNLRTRLRHQILPITLLKYWDWIILVACDNLFKTEYLLFATIFLA